MKTYDLTSQRPAADRAALLQTNRAGAGSSAPGKGYSLGQETLTSVLATVVLGVVVSGLYPLAVWGLGQGIFKHRADGG